ncbi:zinc finger, CCHC-type containing protein [Tanacetum coccineum]
MHLLIVNFTQLSLKIQLLLLSISLGVKPKPLMSLIPRRTGISIATNKQIELNWLERLPTGSITTWEDLTTRFLAQFFLPGRTAKLRNDILMFQQHQGESLSEAWTHFKDLLQKVPYHGINLWLLIQIFYDHVDYTTQMGIDYVASGRLRKLRPDEAWATIEELA